MSLLLPLTLLSAPMQPVVPLECDITKATYEMPGAPDWAVDFYQPKHPPTAASDLLMVVQGIDFVRDFALTSAQGFGGTSLLATKDDQDEGQPLVADDQPEDSMAFHAFYLDDQGGLTRSKNAPVATDKAPVAIYIPDVSKHFWYDEHYVDNETGDRTPDPVDMPQGLFIGKCVKR